MIRSFKPSAIASAPTINTAFDLFLQVDEDSALCNQTQCNQQSGERAMAASDTNQLAGKQGTPHQKGGRNCTLPVGDPCNYCSQPCDQNGNKTKRNVPNNKAQVPNLLDVCCYNCGQMGHYASCCPNRQSVMRAVSKRDEVVKEKSETHHQAHMTQVTDVYEDISNLEHHGPGDDIRKYLPDSGALAHFTPVLKDLAMIQSCDISITIADGQVIYSNKRQCKSKWCQTKKST